MTLRRGPNCRGRHAAGALPGHLSQCCALSSPRQPPAPIARPPVGTRGGQIGWLGVKLGPHQDVRRQMRTLIRCAGSVALLFLSAGLLSAEDGATLYKQICAACHDTGIERAPNRVALRAMTPERVLAALETGAMISMTSGRTAVERRGVAEFVTGKPFGRPLSTTPSPQSLCVSKAGDFAGA